MHMSHSLARKLLSGAIIIAVSGLPALASAKTAKRVQIKNPYKTVKLGSQNYGDPSNGVSGNVTSISGDSMVMSGEGGRNYIVDLSKAQFLDGIGLVGLSPQYVSVGDPVFVLGQIGKDGMVAAESISDSSLMGRNIFSGTVTSAVGTRLFIESSLKQGYEVETAGAQIAGANGKPLPSPIAVGDRLMVIGTTDGGLVTAAAVNDLGQLAKSKTLKAAIKAPAKKAPAKKTSKK